jgi:hypothetical protein
LAILLLETNLLADHSKKHRDTAIGVLETQKSEVYGIRRGPLTIPFPGASSVASNSFLKAYDCFSRSFRRAAA